MRAIVIRETGPTSVMRLEEIDEPVPGPRDVKISVKACGVCFHDVVTRNGVMKRGIQLPLIPGHEIAGIVVETGSEVRGVKVGDKVCTTQRRHVCGNCRYCRTGRETSCHQKEFLGDVGLNGGYAEFVLVEEDNVVVLPPMVDLKSSAIASCAIGTELGALRDKAHLTVGETVLITGAGGGLGQHGVQLAKSMGAHVIACTSSEDKVAQIWKSGADEVILYERGEDFSRKVVAVTQGYGCDVVLDNVGSSVFNSARKSLAVGGRWVFVGQLTGEFVPINPAQLFFKNVSILTQTSTSRQQLEDVVRLIEQGKVTPVISHEFRLEDAAAAHEAVESGTTTGRVLICP